MAAKNHEKFCELNRSGLENLISPGSFLQRRTQNEIVLARENYIEINEKDVKKEESRVRITMKRPSVKR